MQVLLAYMVIYTSYAALENRKVTLKGQGENTVSTIKRVAIAVVVAFAFAVSAHAQIYHPGQTIKLSVTFDGPDAAKVQCGNVNINLTTEPNANQPSFNRGFGAANCKQIEPGTLELDCTIPDTTASGDYELQAVNISVPVGTTNQSVGFSYRAPDVPALKFKIDNPNTLTQPKLKSVKVLP